MGGDWVNRIGIILNFCAGFLLAPELIGIRRLRRFEKFLEEGLPRFLNFVQSLPARLIPVLQVGFILVWLFSLLSLVLWGLVFVASFSVFDLSVRAAAAIAVSLVSLPLVAIIVASGVAAGVMRLRPSYDPVEVGILGKVVTISMFILLSSSVFCLYRP
jgi:hypothetical protein